MKETAWQAKSPFLVRRVAVLGAGVMGAQIAAHLANGNVEVVLFELAAKEGNANDNVRKAIDGLKKLEPSPLSAASRADFIQAANYDQDLELLKECDVVIEAISERMDWKKALYEKVAPHLGDNAIFASNTSGLSINSLSEAMPAHARTRFCGVHFFNPPRYMHLVELIPGRTTDPAILDQLEEFLVTTLGKGVIRAKDTPNFIANRVGVFSILAAFHHTQKFGLGFDEVDALTGSLIGRPKSATYRTADVVGLDTLAHVVNTMKETLPNDPWHKYYDVPDWFKQLIDQKALGQKSGRGVYRKQGKEIQVLDLRKKDYRPSAGEADEAVAAILKNRNAAERFAQLRASQHPQAQFMWAALRDMLHYCAVHLEAIADNARDLDFAIRWGFGWNQGPFEIWQAAGWQQMAKWIAEDIAAGKAMASVPLPAWVTEPGREGVHTAQGSWSVAEHAYKPRSTLPIYRRQPFPDRLISETAVYGTTVFETDAVRMWSTGDDIGIVSFKIKNACHRRGCARRGDAGHRRVRTQLQGTDLLADRAAVFGRRQSVWRRKAQERTEADGIRVDDEEVQARSGVGRAQGGFQAQRGRFADGRTPGESGAGGRAVPGDLAGTALLHDSDRRSGRRHGPGRRLRVHHAL